MKKTSEELQEIMKEYNVDRLWSWSRFNKFKISPYEYFLKYITKEKEDRQDSIYVATGGISHDVLEKYYTGEITRDNLIDEFENGWITAFELLDLKFDRTDGDKNEKIADKYKDDLYLFFKDHLDLPYHPEIEQFVITKVGEHIFQGYIDAMYRTENDDYYILDWKTSTQYKGDKAIKESGQLCLYALSLMQKGIPLEKIHIGWNFLKYCTVRYEQKNGTIKTRDVRRSELGSKLSNNVKIWLKEFGYKDDMDKYLLEFEKFNSFNVLPIDVQNKYAMYDCFTEVELTQKMIDDLISDIIATIKDILVRENDYELTGNDILFWDSEESLNKNSYYLSNLCSYSSTKHKPYAKYLEQLEQNKEDLEDIFSNNNTKNNTNNNDDDMSWLNDLI